MTGKRRNADRANTPRPRMAATPAIPPAGHYYLAGHSSVELTREDRYRALEIREYIRTQDSQRLGRSRRERAVP